jgi:hypothetical protein
MRMGMRSKGPAECGAQHPAPPLWLSAGSLSPATSSSSPTPLCQGAGTRQNVRSVRKKKKKRKGGAYYFICCYLPPAYLAPNAKCGTATRPLLI